eukprot:10175438-Prorocentrum_lima.AAC.1
MEANIISYNAAISACEKGGEWVRALELLVGMVDAKVEASVISYNAAITACRHAGEWTRALQLL